MPALVRALSPAQLGIWYALQSIAAASYLVDFGFTTTFSRFASYFAAGARTLHPEGLRADDVLGQPNWKGIADLRATTARLYGAIVAVAVALFGAIAVVVVAPEAAKVSDPQSAYGATGVLILAAGMSIVASRYSALLSGIGALAHAMRIGSIAQVLQLAVSFGSLMLGWGLPGLASALLLSAIVTVVWTRRELSRRIPAGGRGTYSPQYLRAMLPTTARLGAVFVGSYLITQANTLVAIRALGAAATASYGLSLQAANFAAASCFIFVNTKTPLFAQMHQRGDVTALRSSFIKSMQRSIASYVFVTLAALLLGPGILRAIGARSELLPLGQLAVLLVVRLLEAHHTAHGTLVVTSNRVPFVVPALASGLLVVALSGVAAPRYGMWAIVAIPGIVQAAWNNWWTVLLGARSLSMDAAAYVRALVGCRGRAAPEFVAGGLDREVGGG